MIRQFGYVLSSTSRGWRRTRQASLWSTSPADCVVRRIFRRQQRKHQRAGRRPEGREQTRPRRFSGVTSRKKMGNVDPKMRCKIWTPFWGPPNCFFFSQAPKRGPDFRLQFGIHIVRFFSQSDAQKGHPRVGCL